MSPKLLQDPRIFNDQWYNHHGRTVWPYHPPSGPFRKTEQHFEGPKAISGAGVTQNTKPNSVRLYKEGKP
jgi:hypothetical protein